MVKDQSELEKLQARVAELENIVNSQNKGMDSFCETAKTYMNSRSLHLEIKHAIKSSFIEDTLEPLDKMTAGFIAKEFMSALSTSSEGAKHFIRGVNNTFEPYLFNFEYEGKKGRVIFNDLADVIEPGGKLNKEKLEKAFENNATSVEKLIKFFKKVVKVCKEHGNDAKALLGMAADGLKALKDGFVERAVAMKEAIIKTAKSINNAVSNAIDHVAEKIGKIKSSTYYMVSKVKTTSERMFPVPIRVATLPASNFRPLGD